MSYVDLLSQENYMLTKKTISLAIASVLLLAPCVRAQFATGNLYGTVNDSSGAALPGATITLTGGTIGARNTPWPYPSPASPPSSGA